MGTPPALPPVARKAGVLLSPANVDAFIMRLNKCMETPSGIDAVLAAVCYGARASALVLSSTAGRSLVQQLATVLALTRGRGFQQKSTALLTLVKRLRALSSLTTEIRTLMRLWGLLSMYAWGRAMVKDLLAQLPSGGKAADDEVATASATKSASARFLDTIAWTQLASCSTYYVLENAAFLSQRGVLGLSDEAQGRANLWSSRAFGIYVLAELARVATELRLRCGGDARQGQGQGQASTAARAEIFELQRSGMRYMAFAPTMLHWSLNKGFLEEPWLTVLGFIPAALQMHKVWTQVAT